MPPHRAPTATKKNHHHAHRINLADFNLGYNPTHNGDTSFKLLTRIPPEPTRRTKADFNSVPGSHRRLRTEICTESRQTTPGTELLQKSTPRSHPRPPAARASSVHSAATVHRTPRQRNDRSYPQTQRPHKYHLTTPLS